MRKVDLIKFRKEVVSIIEANKDKITSFEHADDHSIFTFCGEKYACEVTLTEKWIGYNLRIDTPKGMVDCSLQIDTDIYPIYGGKNEEMALEIYDDLVHTVRSLFAERVYYESNTKFSYIAVHNTNGTYTVRYQERKKLLFFDYTSGWINYEYSASDLKKLKLKVAS